MCSHACVRAPHRGSELGEADSPPDHGSSIPPPPPSLREKRRPEVFLLLFLSVAAEFPWEQQHVSGGMPRAHLGFWELSSPGLQGTRLRRSSSTCLCPGRSRRLPPHPLPEITPARLCKERENPARHPHHDGGPLTPNGEWGELDPGIRLSILSSPWSMRCRNTPTHPSL